MLLCFNRGRIIHDLGRPRNLHTNTSLWLAYPALSARTGSTYRVKRRNNMTRYVMVADLDRCVGCQTCTAACRQTNATQPGVQWRKVLDLEFGEYPDVQRVFVPVGCQHCADPPCMHVCPSTATRQRDDGIVTINYDLCIGCAYCAVACPYQARSKVDKPNYAYGSEDTGTPAN